VCPISCRCFSVITTVILSKEDDRQNATHTADHGDKNRRWAQCSTFQRCHLSLADCYSSRKSSSAQLEGNGSMSHTPVWPVTVDMRRDCATVRPTGCIWDDKPYWTDHLPLDCGGSDHNNLQLCLSEAPPDFVQAVRTSPELYAGPLMEVSCFRVDRCLLWASALLKCVHIITCQLWTLSFFAWSSVGGSV
jgi:hypothetical protein